MPTPSLLAPLALALSSQAWTPLELPLYCGERPAAPWLAPLEDGRHVLLQRADAGRLPAGSVELSPSQLTQMVEAEARRQGRELAVYRGAPPVLVRGPAANIEWARALVEGLDQAARRHEVELHVRLAPGALAPEGAGDVLAPGETTDAALDHSARVRSGDAVAFGERHHHPFVASFDVEVATDSGVASPVIGSVFTGRSVHLRAARADGGRRIHLTGWLDLADLVQVEDFDPDSLDLGVLQQPVVRSVQVAFSGVVESGGSLAVEVRGADLDQPDWTLIVSASSVPDAAEGPPDGWRVADLALLALEPRSLPAFALGSGLEPFASIEGLGAAARAITPAGLYGLAEGQRPGGARGGAGAGFPTERLVILSSSELESWGELTGLARAMESSRLTTALVALAHGPLSVTLPVASGEAARVVAGTERTFLVDYDAEIAPDTWMPAPRVERAFDGVVWQGRHAAGSLELTAAVARTSDLRLRTSEEAQLGVLQLPVRSARVERARLSPGPDSRVLLRAVEGAPELSLRFGAP